MSGMIMSGNPIPSHSRSFTGSGRDEHRDHAEYTLQGILG